MLFIITSKDIHCESQYICIFYIKKRKEKTHLSESHNFNLKHKGFSLNPCWLFLQNDESLAEKIYLYNHLLLMGVGITIDVMKGIFSTVLQRCCKPSELKSPKMYGGLVPDRYCALWKATFFMLSLSHCGRSLLQSSNGWK